MGRPNVTLIAVAVLAAALCACGPKGAESDAGAPSADGAGFPMGQTASYKATYQIAMGADANDMTIYASGKRMRTENSMMAAATGLTAVTLLDRDAGQFVTYMIGPNAPKRATKLSPDDIKRYDDMMPQPGDAAKPTRVGADTVAGLACTIWGLPTADAPSSAPAEADAARQVCLTNDGIMLRAGPADKPSMVATMVEKGPQDPSLFALPAGYEVIDIGDCMNLMSQYAQSMRGDGPKPDQAKFAECQKKMMGGLGAP